MENSTPFDLNESLKSWRAKLASTSTFRQTDLDELEVHLRDSMADLQGRGLSPQEAFWVACSRLGAPETLCTEFGKVNQDRVWLQRLMWLLAGSLVVPFIFAPISLLTGITSVGLYQLCRQPHLAVILTEIVNLGMYFGLLAIIWHSVRQSNGMVRRIINWCSAHPMSAVVIYIAVNVINYITRGFLLVFSTSKIAAADMSTFFTWTNAIQTSVWILLWPIIFIWLLRQYRKSEAV